MAVPQSEVLAVQRQSNPHGNNPDSDQIQDMDVPRLKWKANHTCYRWGEKGHLAQECPHTCSSAIAQRQQTPIANSQHAHYSGPNLFPATNPLHPKL